MPDNYATAVLYKADIERELYNRATGVDAEDYILVDSLCAEFQNCTLEVNVKNDWGYTPIELARKLPYRADLLRRMTE